MKKLFTSLILSLSILTSILINPVQTLAAETYQYYGIAYGNGTQTTIYLKVSDSWQSYTINSSYRGYTCKLINIDRLITTDNYKDIIIQGIEEPEYNDQINETISAWNERNK